MTWGDKEEFLESLLEVGMSPPTLESKPEIPEYLYHYLSAFWLLSNRRAYGFTANPISITDMVSYLQLYPWYDADEFIRLMSYMDREYLESVNAER